MGLLMEYIVVLIYIIGGLKLAPGAEQEGPGKYELGTTRTESEETQAEGGRWKIPARLPGGRLSSRLETVRDLLSLAYHTSCIGNYQASRSIVLEDEGVRDGTYHEDSAGDKTILSNVGGDTDVISIASDTPSLQLTEVNDNKLATKKCKTTLNKEK
ncbi:hypothetical protein M422DRAFT_255026 [Sphaerobolus stellatus SS14]|uniref:Unplaced genomic scaffold SPHSTscaffold_58, whole genome shotgun sequence n=1 Tax=Sphaerobolus stellatus (strain SS14) TaxID=990650 RepID=A0A0C9V566_SPHS4|nr:hypothetical protein M422DRAFT_255026 [Sphaerobolus stellatus SS14]